MRLLIVRDPRSPLLERLDLDAKNLNIVLVQNGVYSEQLRAKGARSLDVDLRARKLDATDAERVGYDELLDAVFQSDNVLVV